MMVCMLCRAEYEPHKDRCIVCRPCHDRVRALPSQALTIGERLWGKCYERAGCWEFNTPGPDGRAGKIMYDGRQRPAAQVALVLSGSARPSDKHKAHANCVNKMCVRPEHLGWVEWLGGAGPAWSHGLAASDLVGMLEHARSERAKYQRNYRARLKSHGVRSVAELAQRGRMAAAVPAAVPAVAAPEPLRAPPEPAPVALEPEPVAPKPAGLLASLTGAKIAPVD